MEDYKITGERLLPAIDVDNSLQEIDRDGDAAQSLIGQDRAKQALHFGLEVKSHGYNMYVMGEQATGRFTLINDFIKDEVKHANDLFDWCYINNFENEREPAVLRLRAGESAQIVKDFTALVDEVLATFPAAYENPGFQRRKAAITRHYEQKYDNAIDKVEAIALEQGIALVEDANTVSFSPIVDGKVVSDNEFTGYPENIRKEFYERVDRLEVSLTEALIEMPSWQRENNEKRKALKKEVTEQAIRPLLKELQRKYADNLQIQRHINTMKPHLIETVIEHLDAPDKDDKHDEYDHKEMLTQYYVPNVIVHNKSTQKVPLIYEPNPTYQNLFGKIEYTNIQGSVFTNYRMITAGAMHKANGGYLVLDADKLFENKHVWEPLKLALKFDQLKMDVLQYEPGMVNSMTLTPEPIKLDLKLILLGSRGLYYALQDYDSDFPELFKVLVDFDDDIDLTPVTLSQFCQRIQQEIQQLGMRDISKQGLARLVTYSMRQCEHQGRLNAKFASILELLNETAFFCRRDNKDNIELKDIEYALTAKKHRTSRVSTQFASDIQQGQILITTDGKDVGTVNGLTVLDIGNASFGTPARITATVYVGANGVVDIEREVELGQSIHSKGVLLLSGYLGNKFAQDFSLTLSANIALEQNYGYVDGDSASLAELMCLISALADEPLNQGIAVTGSINQFGEVQAVGGLNEKIEGFFSLCRTRGLTGSQGVMIPASNVVNLVLDKDVVDAVNAGDFNIYAVETVDQALEISTGKQAGTLRASQYYPANSINAKAVNRLREISTLVNGE